MSNALMLEPDIITGFITPTISTEVNAFKAAFGMTLSACIKTNPRSELMGEADQTLAGTVTMAQTA